MISGRTKLYALIGDPVEQSLSPAMINAAFRELGLDCVYLALRVPQQRLADAMAGVRALGISGLNVTHPHKVGILGLLDELDEFASMVGAVNTVKNEGGRLVGFNTDGPGAVLALKQELGELAGKSVVLLGAGGAARAIAFSLAKEGARLTIANRTVWRARQLAMEMGEKLDVDVKHMGIERKELARAVEQADVLINATTVGMRPNLKATLVTADMMHSGLLVNDIVYDPLETRLLREAKKVGARTLNGLGMLLYQGALALEIWTGKKAPIKVMEAAAKRELRRRGEKV
ncbi:MAG: shikimate dehydrogenase [Candidatus Hadarchaeales archaeon]